MKNFKRTLALVLAVIMIAGMFASVSAASAKWYAKAVHYVEAVGIATIGSSAEDKITRDEFVLWIAKLESGVLNDAYWNAAIETPFTDITEEHNQTAIWYSARRGLIVGNGDGTFAPDKNLTFAEAAAVIVRLMRYTSKVEGGAEDWAWANMEVANEYCNAFTNEFLDNVGGSVYDYDYELTKGEVAYLLATIMNAPEEIIKGQIDKTNPYKTTYKSLTIDGMNLGERFYDRWNDGVGVGLTSNTYYVSSIQFNDATGTVVKDTEVALTPVNGVEIDPIEYDDFTSLVRVSLGLSADKAEDEDEINVRNTVNLGTLLDVVVDDDGDVVSIKVHSGSKVVDTHIVMDSMIGGVANWTCDSVVTGASNSNEYREAIINGTWSSDLLYTWTYKSDNTKAVLAFAGVNYTFSNKTAENGTAYVAGDLEVLVWDKDEKELVPVTGEDAALANVQALVALVPDVATGEVTLIFNDYDLDGKYDALVVAEEKLDFETRFYENVTINNKYYSDGYSVDATTASGKLQLVVLANGRFGMGVSGLDSDADGKLNEDLTIAEINARVKEVFAANNATLGTVLDRGLDEWYDVVRKYITWDATTSAYKRNDLEIADEDKAAFIKDAGNEMNAYQVIDLATISSGVIVESTLKAFSTGEKYFVVKVQNAAGATETVYIPYSLTGENAPTAPKFDYTINGITKEFDTATAGWDVEDKLSFVEEAKTIAGIADDAENATEFAKNAAKLVGQYISYIVKDGVACYCVTGAPEGDTGYVLNVAATNVENLYNITIANVDANGAIVDVKLYSVNATASVMMGANYDKISAIFNKANVHVNTDLGSTGAVNTVIGENSFVTDTYVDGEVSAFIPVSVHSNGSFSYIKISNDVAPIDYAALNTNKLLSNTPVIVLDVNDVDNDDDKTEAKSSVVYKDGDRVLNVGTDIKVDKDGKLYIPVTSVAATDAGKAGDTIKVYRTYSGEFYSRPLYVLDETDADNEKWVLTVDTNTVTVTYTFGVDKIQVTKSNYADLSDTKLSEVLYAAINGKFLKDTTVEQYNVDNKTLETVNKAAGGSYNYKNWVSVTLKSDGSVVSYDYYNGKGGDNTYVAANTYEVPAKVSYDANNNVQVTYDFRGVDTTALVKIANKVDYYVDADGNKVTPNGEAVAVSTGFFTLTGTASVAEATYTADMTTAIGKVFATEADPIKATSFSGKSATTVWSRTVVDADSSVSNVAFTAMDSTEAGYIPGSYWFTPADNKTFYFVTTAIDDGVLNNGDGYAKNQAIDAVQAKELKDAGYAANYTSVTVKYRTTVNTEVVLLTPTTSGYSVKVMTPAEAAAKNLIVSYVSYVVPAQIAAEDNTFNTMANVKYNEYSNYNNKLDAIVLIGQEALVATTTPETDDGKVVGANEYLVYVPTDVETVLVAPEGSKTVKVAATKSVYAIPSGEEIGAIYYEYDVYSGTEAAKVKTEIAAGWYVVSANGEIIDSLGNIATTADSTNKYNGKFVNDAVVTVKDGKVVATVYVQDKNYKNTSTVLATYDLESATLLYKDVDGTLKVVDDKDATFASASTYNLTIASAYNAVKDAYTKLNKGGWSSAKKAELKAAYDAAVVAYNEALAANIDKFYNGDIWDSFKATVAKETSIQGAGQYTVDVYNVDGKVFVILNDWTPAESDAYGVATVASNLK